MAAFLVMSVQLVLGVRATIVMRRGSVIPTSLSVAALAARSYHRSQQSAKHAIAPSLTIHINGQHQNSFSNSCSRCFASVTGSVYNSPDPTDPSVRLFTKEGCTLCDKVKDTLFSVRNKYPHSLYQVDITDDEHKDWFEKYKYDIPILHINNMYWTKHRLSAQEAEQTFEAVLKGAFSSPPGEPNAGKMTHDI
ncbi:hypothetical protein ACA910_004192 [Epithemia clementina (nom. ined.)]